jgi:septum formation protein
MLFSKPHKVITGVAIVCKSRKIEIVEADTTVVFPKKMTEEQIARHIKSGIWQDKAGAYAIQEQADPFVDHIDGSMTNVMGLPMETVKRLLSHRFHR